MANKGKFAEIGILLYPEVQASAVHGLTELFDVANRLAELRPSLKRPVLRISRWRLSSKAPRKVRRVYDTHPEEKEGNLTALIVPPSLGNPISKQAAAPFARWLAGRHDEGTLLCSVCRGAFVLAEAGLLGGRTVTTHWYYAGELARRYPEIKVDSEKLLIEERDIVTAGGMMAWSDLGLTLVDRFLGSQVMLETARFLLVDPPGREQRFYRAFVPVRHHGDPQILKVQEWLQSRGAKAVTVQAMASKAGLEPRTFLRRFRKSTGMNPNDYCQNLRVLSARELLETSRDNIDRIARRVGYQDPGAFRKVFHKVTGLAPGEYRGRFGR